MSAPTVLIVEDEALIALLLERQFKGLGCRSVGRTASGEEALEIAGRGGIDLVLMDIHLAGEMDGLEAGRIMAGLAGPPLVAFMTAFGDDASRQAARALDPLDFLEKPLGQENLRALIARWEDRACPH